ncbi:MAG TPA: hypothetical protein VJQ82_25815 [Terriglobales bacterium]|nr:hypothetical protein [Terriglobales bacterium]
MKIGAEDKKKLIIAIVLMAVALIVVGEYLFNSSSAPSASAPSSGEEEGAARPKAPKPGKKTVTMARSLDPELRFDWLRASEDTKYQGNGRNIFRAQEVVIPQPVAPAKKEVPPPPQPQGPPPPPPITLKFFGFANRPGEAKKVFLEQGEDIFVASEGDIVDRRYKVLRIGPTFVEVEDVLNNNRQSIPLTQG